MLQIATLEHVLIEKVERLFRNMLLSIASVLSQTFNAQKGCRLPNRDPNMDGRSSKKRIESRRQPGQVLFAVECGDKLTCWMILKRMHIAVAAMRITSR